MQQSAVIDDIGFSPSFNCYSNDSLTSAAATKVSRELKDELGAGFQDLTDIDEEDFQFSLEYDGEEFSAKELELDGRLLFPIFNSDLVTQDEVDHDDSNSLVIPLEKLFLGGTDDSLSSSSEAEESEDQLPSGSFRLTWRKGDVGSPTLADYKKSKSTGSESIKGKIKDIFRRSNSAGRETVLFLCLKRVAATKQKRIVNSGETPKVTGKSKKASSRSVHELFYVQKRAEHKGDKMKSYLPYRQDILGFYVNVNGNSNNKKLPF